MRESDTFHNDTVCLKDLLLLKCVSEITASEVHERRVSSFFSLKTGFDNEVLFFILVFV